MRRYDSVLFATAFYVAKCVWVGFFTRMKSMSPLDLSRMNRAVFEALGYDKLSLQETAAAEMAQTRQAVGGRGPRVIGEASR